MEGGGKTENSFKESTGVTLLEGQKRFFKILLQWLLLLSADPAFNMKSHGTENRQLIKELGRGDSWIPYGSSQCHARP